jgi:hypothetical protein
MKSFIEFKFLSKGECLPSMYEVLGLIPGPKKKKKKVGQLKIFVCGFFPSSGCP